MTTKLITNFPRLDSAGLKGANAVGRAQLISVSKTTDNRHPTIKGAAVSGRRSGSDKGEPVRRK
jgi:hypothetical protein